MLIESAKIMFETVVLYNSCGVQYFDAILLSALVEWINLSFISFILLIFKHVSFLQAM